MKKESLNLLRKLIVLTMLGSLMFVSKIIMEFLPNIHLVGALVIVCTLVYRSLALIPIYIFVFLSGLYMGFALWWVPYLYVWTILWAVAMLLPRKLCNKKAVPLYIAVCALHGLCFGILYAPFQALVFGYSWKQALAWVVAGFPFDVVHCVGNAVAAVLIYPLARVLKKLEQKFSCQKSDCSNSQT